MKQAVALALCLACPTSSVPAPVPVSAPVLGPASMPAGEDPPAASAPWMVIVQPGYPGTTEMGEGFVATLTRYLSAKAGIPGLTGAYYNRADKALEAIEERRPPFGIVSLGFYLEHRRQLGLKALSQSKPADNFVIVGRTGDVKKVTELEGETVAGSTLHELKLLQRIIFADGIRVSKWDVRPTLSATALRNLLRERYRAAVLTGRDWRSFRESPPYKETLEIIHESEYYPPALVVAFGASGKEGVPAPPPGSKEGRAEASGEGIGKEPSGGAEPGEEPGAGSRAEEKQAPSLPEGVVERVPKALEGLSKDPDGREILDTMGSEGFEPIPAGWLEKLERRYDAEPEGK